jgi:hypothetical protein
MLFYYNAFVREFSRCGLIKFGKIKQYHFVQIHHFQDTSMKPPRGGFYTLKPTHVIDLIDREIISK